METTRGYLGIGLEQARAEGREGLAALGAAVGRGADGGGREDARRRHAAGDALGQVSRADETQAERVPVHGRRRGWHGLDRRRRHCCECWVWGIGGGFWTGLGTWEEREDGGERDGLT